MSTTFATIVKSYEGKKFTLKPEWAHLHPGVKAPLRVTRLTLVEGAGVNATVVEVGDEQKTHDIPLHHLLDE